MPRSHKLKWVKVTLPSLTQQEIPSTEKVETERQKRVHQQDEQQQD